VPACKHSSAVLAKRVSCKPPFHWGTPNLASRFCQKGGGTKMLRSKTEGGQPPQGAGAPAGTGIRDGPARPATAAGKREISLSAKSLFPPVQDSAMRGDLCFPRREGFIGSLKPRCRVHASRGRGHHEPYAGSLGSPVSSSFLVALLSSSTAEAGGVCPPGWDLSGGYCYQPKPQVSSDYPVVSCTGAP
jgi:hypothetical protein